MSKVIHLSDRAHEKAKKHCRGLNTPMSDWVAYLIESAVLVASDAPASRPLPQRVDVVRKKRLDPASGSSNVGSEGQQVYTSPPFWKDKASTSA